MEAVSRLIEQGKVRFAGVSNYTPELMAQAEQVVPVISNQVPYSMLRKEIEKDLIPYCMKRSKGILAYSPLQRGVLTGKFSSDHRYNDGDTRMNEKFYSPENIMRVNAFLGMINPIAENKNISITQLVICWTLQQPGISAVLVGARNKEQALHNAKAIETELSAEDIAFINTKIDEIGL